jgi:hypothetical protein
LMFDSPFAICWLLCLHEERERRREKWLVLLKTKDKEEKKRKEKGENILRRSAKRNNEYPSKTKPRKSFESSLQIHFRTLPSLPSK